ncbi:unnamed protein product [Arabidopsis thaliana]|uniref:Uncharacterized protein n=1 Tax=Arabidopsis thaliana TaxID=3702 RepID=A0A654FM66_ARATH|nr:unnamed protein product [Arabidopsis thaliana]
MDHKGLDGKGCYNAGHGLSTRPSRPNSRCRGSLTLCTAFVLHAYYGRTADVLRAYYRHTAGVLQGYYGHTAGVLRLESDPFQWEWRNFYFIAKILTMLYMYLRARGQVPGLVNAPVEEVLSDSEEDDEEEDSNPWKRVKNEPEEMQNRR